MEIFDIIEEFIGFRLKIIPIIELTGI